MQFQNTALNFTSFSVLLVIIVLFALMLRTRYRQPTPMERPSHDLAYEWLAEPLKKASAGLCKKFTILDELPDVDGIQLIRLGIFNLGTTTLQPIDFEEPIMVEFDSHVELLAAEIGETHRTPMVEADVIKLDNEKICIAPLTIASGGTVIFNIVSRNCVPIDVTGSIAGFGNVRRLN